MSALNQQAKRLGIPVPSLRRLPGYHQYLKKIDGKREEYVSATSIARDLNLVPIQVRKDLAYTGISGKPKLGYPIKELITEIEEFLDWNNTKQAFLVGVGDLGRAILKYKGFEELGLKIIAAFDIVPDQVEKVGEDVKIFDIKRLSYLVERMKVNIGIITVPWESAQEVADEMIKGGIKGIWNFAPVELKTPSHIIVQNVNLASSLSVLCKQLSVKISHKKYKEEIR